MAHIARRTFGFPRHIRLNTLPALTHTTMKTRSFWARVITSLKSLSKLSEEPRTFPTSGFQTIETDGPLIEEEGIPNYVANRFYPVILGDVFEDRYQVVGKLGFGSSSTIWLARDLKNFYYVTLKIYAYCSMFQRELPFYNHIHPYLTQTTTHRGRRIIRRFLRSFEIIGPHGKHSVLVFEASQMSLRDMKTIFFYKGFEESFVKGAVIELLQAIDFLHTHGNVVHTDIHSGNLLLGAYDPKIFDELGTLEFKIPTSRKVVSEARTIYLSRIMKPKGGPMLLSDFGETRIGPGPHGGDIMPLEYRAPEVLLYVKWSYPVDIWSVGLTAWDLLGLKTIFTARDKENGNAYDAVHFAEMIAALGPPPDEFLGKNLKRKADFWDENGKWLELATIPHGRTLESLENRLSDNQGFLRFLRRTLTWMPEERATAKELLQDPWLA